MIRVMYRLRVRPGGLEIFERAWRDIVSAHTAANHGAMESMLVRDVEDPTLIIAISRWESRARWETNQTDDVALEAFERLRSVSELEGTSVFDELALVRAV